jgi:uncharacterized protein YerC
MGRAYTEEQRLQVKALLEQGREEDAIEKETGVSDRTIRRWKLELERTGRIGKVKLMLYGVMVVLMIANRGFAASRIANGSP